LADPNGNKRIIKKDIVISDKDVDVPVYLSDSEQPKIIPPNLVYGNG
jgi:hypothetical protein